MGQRPKPHVAQPTFKNILGQAKRHSRYRTVLHVSSLTLKNIPHEEVFRGMQIL
jgi:hypothetical protein